MIRTIISKVASVVAASAAQWMPALSASEQLQIVLRWLGGQTAGTAISISGVAATMPQVPAVALVGAYAGTTRSPQAAGVGQIGVANLGTSKQVGAGKVVNVTWSLAGDYGAATAASTAASSNIQWTNPTNAQGKHDAVFATIVASLSAVADANLTMTYAALPNKTAFTIASVALVFYATMPTAVGQTTALIYSYSLNGGTSFTTLQTYNTVAVTDSAGKSFDITAAIAGNWANLQSLQTLVRATLQTSAVSTTASVDAVELVITGSLTYTP